MLKKVLLILILLLVFFTASKGLYPWYQESQNKNILYELANSLGYSTESATFKHEKASWNSIASNHDYMLLLISTEETEEEITTRLNNSAIPYSIPTTIYGDLYINYWLISFGNQSIIARLKSGKGINDYIDEPVTMRGPRYIELYLNRNK